MTIATGVVNEALSRDLASRFATVSKYCYENCHGIVRRCRRSIMTEARYTEGFCVDRNLRFAFEHAWIELADGSLVEPTLVLLDRYQVSRYAYFGALRCQRVELPIHLHAPLHVIFRSYREADWRMAAESAHILAGWMLVEPDPTG